MIAINTVEYVYSNMLGIFLQVIRYLTYPTNFAENTLT